MPDEEKSRAEECDPVDGFEMWRWPEFQQVLRRLGVDLEAPTTVLTLRVPCGGPVEVTQEYFGVDLCRPRKGPDECCVCGSTEVYRTVRDLLRRPGRTFWVKSEFGEARSYCWNHRNDPGATPKEYVQGMPMD